MNHIHKVLGSVAVASIMAIAPLTVSADTLNANAATGVVISPSGIVRVIGADVTAVGNGFVNAVTTIGNAVLNWVVNISAATKVSANGSKTATTTDIHVGDTVSFKGALTATSSSGLSVLASKIRDLTTFPFKHVIGGKISSVNSASGSFVITKGDRSVTVQTNASTTITVNGAATTTLASLKAGDEVKVSGTPNADGSVITAVKVVVKNHEADQTEKADKKEANEGKQDSNHDNGKGKGDAHDASANANVNVHADEHAALKFLNGLHLGIGKDD